MSEIDRLAALLEAGTKGPWRSLPTTRLGHWKISRKDDAYAYPDMEALIAGVPGDGSNAALIVAAVNALPRLLAVARAAEALPRNALHVGACSSVLTVELNALRAALAALEHARVPTRD